MTHSDGTTTPQSPGARLRVLLATGELIVAPGVFDGISAHLVRRTGFKAAYLTGAGTAASGVVGRSPRALFELVGLTEWQVIGDAFTAQG